MDREEENPWRMTLKLWKARRPYTYLDLEQAEGRHAGCLLAVGMVLGALAMGLLTLALAPSACTGSTGLAAPAAPTGTRAWTGTTTTSASWERGR